RGGWTCIRGSARPASGTPLRGRRSWKAPGESWSTRAAVRSATTSAARSSTATSSPWVIRPCRGASGSAQSGPGRRARGAKPRESSIGGTPWMSSPDRGDIRALIDIMARLRNPDGGCPWDLEQDFASIAPYTVEEAYEVADAIDRGDMDDLRGELGDLLLQVVFHARMAEEAGHFAFGDVVAAICDKMVSR